MPAPLNNKNAEKIVDWHEVNKLLNIGCIGEEIASILELDYDTIQNHCKKDHKILFSDYIKKYGGNFKRSLRRSQYLSAIGLPEIKDDKIVKWIDKPNPTMLIWLGKQHLNQSDKMETATKEMNLTDFASAIEKTTEVK